MKKVFIAENNTDIAKIIEYQICNHEMVEVVGATHNVSQGKAFLLANKIDVLLLDINLKDGSGVKLLECCQKDGKKPWIVVISMYREYKQFCLNKGADYFVDKSEGIIELKNIMEEIISIDN